MKEILAAFVAIVTAVIGVALLAVFVAPNAKTANVIKETLGGVGGLINSAVSPLGVRSPQTVTIGAN